MASTEGLGVQLNRSSCFGHEGHAVETSQSHDHELLHRFPLTGLIEIAPPLKFKNHPSYKLYQGSYVNLKFDHSDNDDFQDESYDSETEDPGSEYSKPSDHELEPNFDFYDPASPTLAGAVMEEPVPSQPIHDADRLRIVHLPSRANTPGKDKPRPLEPIYGLDRSPLLRLPSRADAARKEEPLYSNFANIKVLLKPLPTSDSQFARKTRSESGVSSRDRRRRRRRAKTKAQYLRDQKSWSWSSPTDVNTAARAASVPAFSSVKFGPKRKHHAFVQEQELKCLFEDRVGTPHLSELQPGDDVNAQLSVDELSVGGEVAALRIGDQVMQGPSTFDITNIPNEVLRLK